MWSLYKADKTLTERNKDDMGELVVALLDKKNDPKDFDKEVERVEKLTKLELWKNTPSQGGANISNAVNYKKYYNKK